MWIKIELMLFFKKLKKISLFFIVYTIIFSWIFSGWPQIWQNPAMPPEIQQVYALTIDTYYGTYDAANSDMTNPSYAETDNTQYAYGGKNKIVVIEGWVGTAGNGAISGVRIYAQHYADGSDGNDYTLVDYSIDNWIGVGATTGQQVMTGSEQEFSVDITSDRSWTWTDIGNLEVRAAAKASGKQNFTDDYIDVLYIQVDYTPNSAPNAPSQDLPTGGATGVSVTPNFKMTATDPDSDDLGYKVTIYSNVGCSSVVSTHDQAITSTGWTGTDASCTGDPTSCYASGTQGDFTLQAGDALSNSTQYWWRASAQDPDGAGTFTDSATCNDFTTEAAAVISITLDQTSFDYGFVPDNTASSTLNLWAAAGITATNDGNVTEDFDIYSENTGNWTLAGATASDEYIHKFCNDTDNDCSSPPTNYTALTTSPQTLKTGISSSGTMFFQLELTTPNPSTVYTEQSSVVTVQASQQ
jgi:hypothetical protein